ncbi:hypothetical protein HDU79_011921 [Rhizoclosmatium sp. JEL0117]|nr:hypothetical protein HDU79_011921 [Rhizoclosmatium sp. JEL0117]
MAATVESQSKDNNDEMLLEEASQPSLPQPIQAIHSTGPVEATSPDSIERLRSSSSPITVSSALQTPAATTLEANFDDVVTPTKRDKPQSAFDFAVGLAMAFSRAVSAAVLGSPSVPEKSVCHPGINGKKQVSVADFFTKTSPKKKQASVSLSKASPSKAAHAVVSGRSFLESRLNVDVAAITTFTEFEKKIFFRFRVEVKAIADDASSIERLMEKWEKARNEETVVYQKSDGTIVDGAITSRIPEWVAIGSNSINHTISPKKREHSVSLQPFSKRPRIVHTEAEVETHQVPPKGKHSVEATCKRCKKKRYKTLHGKSHCTDGFNSTFTSVAYYATDEEVKKHNGSMFRNSSGKDVPCFLSQHRKGEQKE